MNLDTLLYGLVAIFLGACMGLGMGLGQALFKVLYEKKEKEVNLSI